MADKAKAEVKAPPKQDKAPAKPVKLERNLSELFEKPMLTDFTLKNPTNNIPIK